MSDGRSNVVLIGMPSSGKSTMGVLLAKALGKGFVDTDLVVQQQQHRTLAEIIAEEGLEGFCRIEEETIAGLTCKDSVIATGGSVVYSERAMAHLRQGGTVVWLDLPPEQIRARIGDPAARGVVLEPGQTLESLYDKRRPLYERYAGITIECSYRTHGMVLDMLLRTLKDVRRRSQAGR